VEKIGQLNRENNDPLVSIITPAFNQVDFLEKTIQSVLNQQYGNVEYIIIDGGSTDGTIDIIKKYEKYLKYWVSEKDSGMYDAVNKGLKIAKGEIVAYLNSDDMYYSETVHTVVDYFKIHPEISLVYGDCDFIDSVGKYLYTYHYPDFNRQYFIMRNWSSIPQPASFWRQEVHSVAGYFDESFKMAGDFEFYARIGKQFTFAHVDKIKAMFRIHKRSLSSTCKDIDKKERKKIYKLYGDSSGVRNSLLKIIAELQVKLLNIPLMLKKITGLQRRI